MEEFYEEDPRIKIYTDVKDNEAQSQGLLGTSNEAGYSVIDKVTERVERKINISDFQIVQKRKLKKSFHNKVSKLSTRIPQTTHTQTKTVINPVVY